MSNKAILEIQSLYTSEILRSCLFGPKSYGTRGPLPGVAQLPIQGSLAHERLF